MKKSFVGFWGEPIKNVQLNDQGDKIEVYGMAQCPKEFLESKTGSLENLNLNQMVAVPVCFEVSKETNQKEGIYRLYTPGEIEGFKIPSECEERYSPLLFECTYHEDKLKDSPIFFDKDGKKHTIVLEKKSFFPSIFKKFKQNKRG